MYKKSIQEGIFINGIPMNDIREWYTANTGYVLQLATPYYEELTVRENLTLAAEMKLPSSMTLHDKLKRVEQVIQVVRICLLEYLTHLTVIWVAFLFHRPVYRRLVI